MAAMSWGILSSGHRGGVSLVLTAYVSPAERRDAVDCIRAPYAAGLACALRLLQFKWRQLCDDLESGTVSADVIIDAAMRGAVQDGVLAGPCPELAGRVRHICEREDWCSVTHRR
ncbi:hypothetical protein E2562_021310 [Oryza meyeriana var. granulata]|uniref:Uncharacterized protein n=1 Tax=Oryza meyeriana var. granulata TaxID=110450 RepID=A0A6G1BZC5_9ORYZ|nr:hypothetical protein E2562_021310 [Oryza meyeriana var. granulata]